MTWVDGLPCRSVAVDDRGLLLADGVFETIRWSGLGVFRKALHIARLTEGLKALVFDDPAAQVALAFDQLKQALNSLPAGEAGVARITVTRGSGPRGYAPSATAVPRIVISLFVGHTVSADPARLIVAKIRWPIQPQLAGLKLLARTEQVLAAYEASQAGAVDAVMLNQNGSVISSATGNLFIRCGQKLLTPALHEAGIAGTRRAVILSDLAAQLGFEAQEVTMSLDDVLAADEVFTSNSVVGIRSVAQLLTRSWSEFPASEALAALIPGEPV